MEEELKNIAPIKPELRPIIEEFLAYPEYQTLFIAFAKHAGYTGEDSVKAKKHLFTIKDGEIGFNVVGMNDLFLEFQLLKQLSDTEPYRSLLEKRPAAISQLRELSKKILNKETITNKQIEEIFHDGEEENNNESQDNSET